MPRKSTKKITAKTNKLNKPDQTHGKSENLEGLQPVTLDQIWGDYGLSKYSTMDESVYAGQLQDMSMSDIQNHAATIGLIPTSHRGNLTKKLITEFKKHVASYVPSKIIKSNSSQEIDPEVLKILKEGQ